jgi:hypothetical protein
VRRRRTRAAGDIPPGQGIYAELPASGRRKT